MMNESSFPNGSGGNMAPYSLAEIWQFPAAVNGAGLGLRRPQFGQFGDFASGSNRDVGPVGSDQKAANHGIGIGANNRKRRDSEDESAKVVSTSNGGGNGVVFNYSFTSLFLVFIDSI